MNLGKLLSFVVKRDREMRQYLEEDVRIKVGFPMMGDPRTSL